MKIFSIKAPASESDIEKFIGEAYASEKPLGLFASNGEDWTDDRDAVVDCLMGKNNESQWFMCLKHGSFAIQLCPYSKVLGDDSLSEYYARSDLFDLIDSREPDVHVGYARGKIVTHGKVYEDVLREALSEGWAQLEEDDTSALETLEIVQAMAKSIEIICLDSKSPSEHLPDEMHKEILKYSDLRKTKITWVDRNGVRCIADLCYRLQEDVKGTEVQCVVTERADNPGMSITNSAEQVVNAIISRFPEPERVLITERYDERSYSGGGDEKARYAQYSKADGSHVKFNPVHPSIQKFFDIYWNDRI